MANLKIPKLNRNSDKFFFKKKLNLRRKSKSKLLKESFILLSLSSLLIYLNCLIPNKKTIFYSIFNNFDKFLSPFLEIINYLYDFVLAIFMIFSLFLIVIFICGAFSRLFKLIKRKSMRINF